MRDVVAVGPGHRRADRHGERRRPEAEVVDLDVRGRRRAACRELSDRAATLVAAATSSAVAAIIAATPRRTRISSSSVGSSYAVAAVVIVGQSCGSALLHAAADALTSIKTATAGGLIPRSSRDPGLIRQGGHSRVRRSRLQRLSVASAGWYTAVRARVHRHARRPSASRADPFRRVRAGSSYRRIAQARPAHPVSGTAVPGAGDPDRAPRRGGHPRRAAEARSGRPTRSSTSTTASTKRSTRSARRSATRPPARASSKPSPAAATGSSPTSAIVRCRSGSRPRRPSLRHP